MMITNLFQFFLLICLQLISEAVRPNILLILADDLGWGDVSFHNSEQISTPNLDLLASSGIILNNYYVSPVCSPSRSALLTGYNPIRTGMQVGVIAASEPYGLPLNFTTMGQHFQRLGYRTHLVGKWHQGLFRTEYLPTRRGFHSFFGYLTGHADYYTREAGDRYRGFDLQDMEHNANLTKYNGQYSTDMYTARVVDLISDKSNKQPWLIYMAQQSVHVAEATGPIEPPKRHLNDHRYIKHDRRRRFAGMVSALDESLGRVFQALNETGQLHQTIIVFSTDNGAPTGGLNGRHIDQSEGSNYPLKGGKYTLWEGGVRGTGFVWYHKNLGPARLSNQLMHITDILPTLYSAAGGDLHNLGPIDGVDHWKHWKNGTNDDYLVRQHLLHNIDHQNHFWAVRYYQYKLTNGTYSKGNYDNWYQAPGQIGEHSPNGICYNCTKTYRILLEHGLDPKPRKVVVDCRPKENPLIKCNATMEMCLYDLKRDPCELTNLSKKRPDLVKKIYQQIFKHYDEQYTRPVNQPSDPQANPALRDGFWKPWKDNGDNGDNGDNPNKNKKKSNKSSKKYKKHNFQ